jgi:hypothetical protein
MPEPKESPQRQAARLRREVEHFNAAFKVGGPVAYQEVLADHCPVQVFTTRSEATILSGHSAVVWLNGKSGCVLVSHCRKPTPEEEFNAAEEIRRADALARIKAHEAEARREALRQLDAVPYFTTPSTLKLMPRDLPVSDRKVELYSAEVVKALVKSVDELLRLATRLDIPDAEQIEIAERARNLLDKIHADEPVPF